ncbi:hypothetical protein MUN89_09610 [Halobacillus salinarum]|uniref:Bypass of forespore C C-terminal domain-containing protein n=1 Tax=Halobacillus salinarum TaxID=2932257 RepID=A0ABY4EPX3_9BACI|nr:hypothetical protein [Halobacillus salinarum]UOQ46141.1 hypothetical protein MUN89_09610 [Halobacillus salinarum]
MKKRLLIGLAALCTLIWTAALFMYFSQSQTPKVVRDHSGISTVGLTIHEPSDEKLAALFTQSASSEKDTRTILGTKTVSRKWLEDVSVDGRLSIDTVLDELNLTNGS